MCLSNEVTLVLHILLHIFIFCTHCHEKDIYAIQNQFVKFFILPRGGTLASSDTLQMLMRLGDTFSTNFALNQHDNADCPSSTNIEQLTEVGILLPDLDMLLMVTARSGWFIKELNTRHQSPDTDAKTRKFVK